MNINKTSTVQSGKQYTIKDLVDATKTMLKDNNIVQKFPQEKRDKAVNDLAMILVRSALDKKNI